MPRPPFDDEERARIRERILAAAESLFNEDGINAVSMRAIGARVGLSASALYAYFPSKVDLMRAVWLGALEDLTARFHKVADSQEDPIRAIREMGAAYAEFGLQDPVRFRVLFMLDRVPIGSEPGGATREYTPYYVLLGRVEEAIRRGLITRLSDPDLAAQALWGAIHGVVTLINTGPEFPFRSSRAVVDAALDSMLAGLRVEPQKE